MPPGFRFRPWCMSTAVFLVLVWLFLPSRTPPLTLPNGSAFSLSAVTHGTSHSMIMGSWWDRLKDRPMIKRALQFFGAGPLPPSRISVHSRQPTTVFWVEHTGSVRELSLSQSNWRAAVSNEEGLKWPVVVPYRGHYTPIMPWRIEGLPPSGKNLTLDIHMRDPAETNKWLHVGRFTSRNPARERKSMK